MTKITGPASSDSNDQSGKPLIELRDVTKKYYPGEGNFYEALHGISFKIRQSEFVAIRGPSGSGKSTVMHIMGALDMPTTGSLLFKGKDITSYSRDQLAEIRNKQIGFVFQTFNLLPRTTVFKNVEKPMVYGNVPAGERAERVRKVLELVGIEEKAQNLSNQISGGQIQRVAIARALVMEPAIVLADEPTGNIDTTTGDEIMQFLQELNDRGKTIVVVTHDEHIAGYAHRQIRLVDGRIVTDSEI